MEKQETTTMREWVDTYQTIEDRLNVELGGDVLVTTYVQDGYAKEPIWGIDTYELTNIFRKTKLNFTNVREVVEFGKENYLNVTGINKTTYLKIVDLDDRYYGFGYLMEQ